MFRRPKPPEPKVEASPKPVEVLPKPKVLMGGHGPRIMHARMHDLDSADHPNVYVINPANGEVLTYEEATQRWINKAVAGMVQHGNEWHEPDMALKTDLHNRQHSMESALDHTGMITDAQHGVRVAGLHDDSHSRAHYLGSDLDHIDVLIEGAIDGEVLTYYAAGQTWINKANPAAGVRQVQSVIQTADVSTNSPSFVDIASMSITLTTGANKVLIIFSCSAYLDVGSNWGCSRLLIDGVVQDGGSSGLGIKGKMGAPNATRNLTTSIALVGTEYEHNHAIAGDIAIALLDFATIKTLSAGEHTIKVQWRSDASTGMYCRAAQGYEHMALMVIEFAV